jgi:CheY-like chemotaxis protein
MTTNETHPARKTVLIVESDILVRYVLGEHLRGCGFDVIEAASSDEARTVLLAHGRDIHIVLSDARLNGQEGGFALAQWVRSYRPDIRVILTSTLANKSRAIANICGKVDSDTLVRDRLRASRARRARHAGKRNSRA